MTMKNTLLTVLMVVVCITFFAMAVSAHEHETPIDQLCMCPRMYTPVCASNHVTYSNMCEFKCAQAASSDLELHVTKSGEC